MLDGGSRGKRDRGVCLKKFILLFFVIVLALFVFPSVYAAQNCPSYADSASEFETVLRGGLFDFLGNEQDSRLTKAEVQDLADFYNQHKTSNFNSADCLDVGETGQTIRAVLEKYTQILEGGTCRILSRQWSKTQAYSNEQVSLLVQAEGVCQRQTVGFEIYEDDFLTGDDPVQINPVPVAFTQQNNAEGKWLAEWQTDASTFESNDNPEYYFKTVQSGIAGKERSNLLSITLCADADGDGFRSRSCGGEDCNDQDATVSPTRVEQCNNKDDDSDNACTVDNGLNGCACSNGGRPRSDGKDECNNIDDDCDGQVDEDVRLANSQWWNVCRVDFTGDKCTGVYDFIIFVDAFDTKPGDKRWDPRVDLDGDKDVDFQDFIIFAGVYQTACVAETKCSDGEFGVIPCGTNQGICKPGRPQCYLGVMPPSNLNIYSPLFTTFCVGATGPTEELEKTCDNKDNDCDGQVDESLVRQCSNACGTGTEQCRTGQWRGCTAPQPEKEICDQKDSDCDNNIDEGNVCNLFDYNNNGCVDDSDSAEFQSRFGLSTQSSTWNPSYGKYDYDASNAIDFPDLNSFASKYQGNPNACGTCGALPAETCNGVDDNCDRRTDYISTPGDLDNSCGDDGWETNWQTQWYSISSCQERQAQWWWWNNRYCAEGSGCALEKTSEGWYWTNNYRNKPNGQSCSGSVCDGSGWYVSSPTCQSGQCTGGWTCCEWGCSSGGCNSQPQNCFWGRWYANYECADFQGVKYLCYNGGFWTGYDSSCRRDWCAAN